MNCATYHDELIPESSVEILGHSVGRITYRHDAHRAPLAFTAITTLPQPATFRFLVRGFDGECPLAAGPSPDPRSRAMQPKRAQPLATSFRPTDRLAQPG